MCSRAAGFWRLTSPRFLPPKMERMNEKLSDIFRKGPSIVKFGLCCCKSRLCSLLQGCSLQGWRSAQGSASLGAFGAAEVALRDVGGAGGRAGVGLGELEGLSQP